MISQIVDASIFRKNIDNFDYPYGIKGKNLYFLKVSPENVYIIRLTKKNLSNEPFIAAYMEKSESATYFDQKDEEVIRNFVNNNINEERLLLYDYISKAVIFDITNGQQYCPVYLTFTPNINRPLLGISYLYKDNGIIKKLFVMETKPILKSLSHFAYISQTLIAPTKGVVQDFGATVAFIVGNTQRDFPIETETYIDVADYSLAYRKPPEIPTEKLTRLNKVMDDFIEEKRKEDEKAREEKLKDEKLKEVAEKVLEDTSDVKVLGSGVPLPERNKLYLSNIIFTGIVPFSALAQNIELDVFHKDLQDFKSAVALRGKITFYTKNPEVFKEGVVSQKLDGLKSLIGHNSITVGIALQTEEL